MGMPLYMEPNFEDLSCKMKFGEVAPPLDQDPVNTQPCFSRCAPPLCAMPLAIARDDLLRSQPINVSSGNSSAGEVAQTC